MVVVLLLWFSAIFLRTEPTQWCLVIFEGGEHSIINLNIAISTTLVNNVKVNIYFIPEWNVASIRHWGNSRTKRIWCHCWLTRRRRGSAARNKTGEKVRPEYWEKKLRLKEEGKRYSNNELGKCQKTLLYYKFNNTTFNSSTCNFKYIINHILLTFLMVSPILCPGTTYSIL